MEIILKLGFIVFALATSFSATAYAYECNTVMGGCPTDDTTQATSAHMRSDTGIKVDHAPKAAANKVALPAEAQNKLESKKSNGQSLMQTLNKSAVK